MEKRTNDMNRLLLSALAVLLLLAFFVGTVIFAFSKLGERCSYSRECVEGYCYNSTCRFPQVLEKFDVTGNCSFTADCAEGFCKAGECITPQTDEHSIFTPAMGVKSGCAGFIENCSGIWCMFCNVTWVLLAIGSAAAAFVSRKRGRITPILMFALPMLAGLLFFPVIGFILAVLEIFIIAFLKKPVVSGL